MPRLRACLLYTSRKTCRKKIINTREEWEMITDGLINIFNLPINEQRELIKFKYHLNMSTIEVHQKISVISSYCSVFSFILIYTVIYFY